MKQSLKQPPKEQVHFLPGIGHEPQLEGNDADEIDRIIAKHVALWDRIEQGLNTVEEISGCHAQPNWGGIR